ncbi:MAG TPA: addiction module antidote protein, HigA family [Rhodobacteraceae bacterium]|nr:addiction module antidote protein, HigA family [Paracoccaceae bacterium]
MLKRTPLNVTSASVATVMEWYERNEILLVDVREVSEFEKEHIPGALLLPLSGFDPELFPVLDGKTVVLYCAIGKRSEAAGKMLLKEGHVDVVHMAGGLQAWKEAGYEVEEQFEPAPEEPVQPIFVCPAPGAVLRDEFLEPLDLDAAGLAASIGVSPGVIGKIVDGKTLVDAELSLRLARYFCTAGDFWLRLQMEHDLERARHALNDTLRKEISPRTRALCA